MCAVVTDVHLGSRLTDVNIKTYLYMNHLYHMPLLQTGAQSVGLRGGREMERERPREEEHDGESRRETKRGMGRGDEAEGGRE